VSVVVAVAVSAGGVELAVLPAPASLAVVEVVSFWLNLLLISSPVARKMPGIEVL
jgi:hypothetical protein